MKNIKLLTCILILALGCSGCLLNSTGETEVGVRTRKLSLFAPSGVEDKVYPQGATYFMMPFINDWHTFDTKLQNLEMTISSGKGDRKGRDDLIFKTIDGNDISLDVIVAYRINPAKAPYILQNVADSNKDLREKIVRTVARSIPRDVFGELSTEQFYVASQRQVKAEEAKDALQKILEPLGVIVEKVLPKDYRFNRAYQKAIEGRKVAEQQAEKNKAATRAALEEYRRKLEEAKGEVNKKIALADGEFQKSKIEADAYLERQKRIAEAIRIEGEAEAKGITALNKALAGSGGETMVKLKMAEALQGKKIILLPMSEGGLNLKTTNINDLLQVHGLQKIKGN